MKEMLLEKKARQPEDEKMQIFFRPIEDWLKCPECEEEGFREDLLSFRHTCCRRFILEMEEPA